MIHFSFSSQLADPDAGDHRWSDFPVGLGSHLCAGQSAPGIGGIQSRRACLVVPDSTSVFWCAIGTEVVANAIPNPAMRLCGYMQPHPIDRRQIGGGIAVAILLSVALFGLVTRFSQPDRWVLIGTGLLGGALAAGCGRQFRFVVSGVLMACTGICVAFSGQSLQVGFAILFGLVGMLALISGGVVFLRFIREPMDAGD